MSDDTSGSAEFTEIAYEVDGPVATITLDRPSRLNAFTPTMQRELVAALDLADGDDAVRAVVVTGRGRGFCAGADLSAGPETFAAGDPTVPDDPQARSEYRDLAAWPGLTPPDRLGRRSPRDVGGLLTLRIFEATKPVIAAVNGPAVGIGITMTLPMDVRLAAESARFGFVFAGRGIVPEAASSWFLPRVVGVSTALEWTLTARVFDAAEAHERGLVRSVHPDEDLLPAARELASEIAANAAPVSAALTRQMLWRMIGASHPLEAHHVDSRAIHYTGRSPDALEGVSAFLEKRPARWVMRPSTDMPDWYPWWEEPGDVG